MKTKLLVILGLAAGLLMVSPKLLAHHGSRASYDMTKMVTLEGTVTEFRWQNPHIYLMFNVKDDKGNVVEWGAETNSPIVMERDGWTPHELKEGDRVTVTLWPSKTDAPRGFLAKLVEPDGKVTDLTHRLPE